MLKELEESIKSHRLLAIQQTSSLPAGSGTVFTNETMASSTPPITPPTPPLNTQAMAASLLATVAAAAAANKQSSLTPPAVTCEHVSSSASNTASDVQDHYSLRWNNHQNHILHAFEALLHSKALVDVTLVCAEKSIHAHKMVLSACSPFFQRMFAETPCKHPVVVLKDFCGWVVQAIIDFMYRGEISVPQEHLQTVMQAGESLQVRGLVESSIKEQMFRQDTRTPEDYGLLNSSLYSSPELDTEAPTMLTSSSKLMLPSSYFRSVNMNRREREHKRLALMDSAEEHQIETETETDFEADNEQPLSGPNIDNCTSPMPRRKQARPRRRSGDFQLSPIPTPQNLSVTPTTSTNDKEQEGLNTSSDKEQTEHAKNFETLKTVIKTELEEPLDEDVEDVPLVKDKQDSSADVDSGNGNDSHENLLSQDLSFMRRQEVLDRTSQQNFEDRSVSENKSNADSEEMNEDFMNDSDELRCETSFNTTEGPEDLCTTKKDNELLNNTRETSHELNTKHKHANKHFHNNNNNCLELNMKEGKFASNNHLMHPFATASLRELRLDRSHIRGNNSAERRNAAENQNKMEALEAQMQAAAAAAAAAANCDNPFKHMEQQMDLSLAAAAAAAAVSREREREREHAMHREQHELQQQHNMYASNLLSHMGMPGMPNFGPVPGGNPAGHERLEDSLNRMNKEFDANSALNMPNHFNLPDGSTHPSSPFPGMSSALALTPPHMFGLDTPLGLFPPGIDPNKLYNPLLDMSDPRNLGPEPPPFLKKKMPRPKGQHSAPRGGPPRSWTNAELTEALQHVWNKKMTTSQASRIFGIPYNSLLMYVRGKYGKSLKLEQLRKDCISGPPLELLQMGMSGSMSSSKSKNSSSKNAEQHNSENLKDKNGNNMPPDMDMLGATASNNHSDANSNSHSNGIMGNNSNNNNCPRVPSPDLMGPNSIFNPFQQGFYPDFGNGFPGLPLSMLNLLPPNESHRHSGLGGSMHHINLDEDCKSDRSKQSSSIEDEMCGSHMGAGSTPSLDLQPLALNRDNCEGPPNSIPSANSATNRTAEHMSATSVQD